MGDDVETTPKMQLGGSQQQQLQREAT